MHVADSGESAEYRTARNRLLEQEIELQQSRAVSHQGRPQQQKSAGARTTVAPALTVPLRTLGLVAASVPARWPVPVPVPVYRPAPGEPTCAHRRSGGQAGIREHHPGQPVSAS